MKSKIDKMKNYLYSGVNLIWLLKEEIELFDLDEEKLT